MKAAGIGNRLKPIAFIAGFGIVSVDAPTAKSTSMSGVLFVANAGIRMTTPASCAHPATWSRPELCPAFTKRSPR